MTADEFALATISQELKMLATTRRASRETWLYTAMPSVVRVATLSNMLAETREREQEAALTTLSGAVSSLQVPRADETPATEPHSSDETWETVVAAAREVRRTFEGVVEAWVLPS